MSAQQTPVAARSRGGAAGVEVPPRGDAAIMVLAVLCAATAPPLIAATAAPALAVAFWRNGLATIVLAPVALWRARTELRRAGSRALLTAALAGTFLALHFGTFMPSLRYTTVASSAALVASQSLWAAVFSWLLGERMPWRGWVGVAVALGGVLLVTGVDVAVAGQALLGDALALLGGMFGGAYIVAGGRARQHLSTTAYTFCCYGICSVLLLVVCLASGQALVGYSVADWVRIAAIMVLAQLLGHSLFNLVLRSASPTVVSLATLFTVPLSAVIAALLLGQVPPLSAVPAVALLLVGVGLVITSRGRRSSEPPPE